MKKFMTRTGLGALVLGLATLAFAAEGSWTGWVTDSHCGAKGATASHKACAEKCVKEKGAKWALYVPADKSVWELSNQAEAAKHAAHEVTVKGTLNKEKKTIEVTSMEAHMGKM